MDDKRSDLEAELRVLHSQLDASSSSIGDWKVIRIYEARLKGEPDPYDYNELDSQREAVRSRIREIEKELSEL